MSYNTFRAELRRNSILHRQLTVKMYPDFFRIEILGIKIGKK